MGLRASLATDQDLSSLEMAREWAENPLKPSTSLNGSRDLGLGGAPDGIRTHGPQIRNLMLYPAELRAHATALGARRGRRNVS